MEDTLLANIGHYLSSLAITCWPSQHDSLKHTTAYPFSISHATVSYVT